jgi:A/G-specific adenine glycosylase
VKLVQSLYDWYLTNCRNLPWREDRNPYKIWISEIMLQQTGVKTVLPYFLNFIKTFPTIESLANAEESQVLSNWAGLGYYSRARNIHKTARLFHSEGRMPKNYFELLNYPGIGPYTSRAISSIAFDEPVGVIDGNVIRILSRLLGWESEWWKSAHKNQFQEFADRINQQGKPPHIINQALMELGATVCTPQKPTCGECPWMNECVAFQTNTIQNYPAIKPKNEKQLWLWQTQIIQKKDELLFVKSLNGPFLKGQWLLPFKLTKLSNKPELFDFRHSVTKYSIFVRREEDIEVRDFRGNEYETIWLKLDKIDSYSQSSITKKSLRLYLNKD